MKYVESTLGSMTIREAYEKIYLWFSGNVELSYRLAGSGYNHEERKKMLNRILECKSTEEVEEELNAERRASFENAEQVIQRVESLPHPEDASDPEMKFILREVISGELEWGYHGSDGLARNYQYIDAVRQNDPSGEALNLSEDEFNEVQMMGWHIMNFRRPG